MPGRKVAASQRVVEHPTADGLLQAAKQTADETTQDVLFCGQTVSLGRAAARDYYKILRNAHDLEVVAGKPIREQVESQLAWVVACLREPKITIEQAVEMSDAVPADFEKLAMVCEHISQGQPVQTFALGVLIAQAAQMVERAEAGTVEMLAAEFWKTILGVAHQFMAGDSMTMPDFAELGKALQGEGVGVQVALDLARSWAERQDVEAKNASEALSASDSSEPVSDGPTEDQQS
jgi:hypothetical protein